MRLGLLGVTVYPALARPLKRYLPFASATVVALAAPLSVTVEPAVRFAGVRVPEIDLPAL